MTEQDGVPYHIQDPLAEMLAMMLFAEYERMDGNSMANWIQTTAENRSFFRQMAMGHISLIRP